MELLNAIIVFKDPAHARTEFIKYHNITNREPAIEKFIVFARKKGDQIGLPAQCVNFYGKDDLEFKFRRYCRPLQ